MDVDGSAFQSCRAVPCAVTVQATFFAAAGARSCCQVERGWAEEVSGVWGWGGGRAGSRRPLAVLAIGSENRRNVGQLCHPFEVGTACLWSGGRVLGFHVLLLGDLGRPELHKPYWLYCLEKKKRKEKKKKKTGTLLSKHSEDRSFMNPRKESAVSFKASLWHNLQTNKKREMYSSVSNEVHLSSRWGGLVSSCIIKQALQRVLEILLTMFSTSSSAHQPSLHDPYDPPNNCAV